MLPKGPIFTHFLYSLKITGFNLFLLFFEIAASLSLLLQTRCLLPTFPLTDIFKFSILLKQITDQ